MKSNDRMYSVEDSPARISRLQAREKALRKAREAAYSSSSQKPFAYYDQSTSSLRTYQHSLSQGSISCSQNLPRSGTMLNGKLYRRESAERCIDENGSSLLPTPTVSDTFTGNLKSTQQKPNSMHSVNLSQVFTIPTPRTSDSEGGYIETEQTESGFRSIRKKSNQYFGAKLKDAMMSQRKVLLPTMTTQDTRMVKYRKGKHGLREGITLPTPGANEFKGTGKDRFRDSPNFHGAKTSEGLRTCEDDPIYLNPSFAEKIMGFPHEWSVICGASASKLLGIQ